MASSIAGDFRLGIIGLVGWGVLGVGWGVGWEGLRFVFV